MEDPIPEELPAGLTLVRTTAVFDAATVPAGLLRAHRVAAEVWGRLVVEAGTVVLVFEGEPEWRRSVGPGEAATLPPGRSHHVELGAGARFRVEFHRRRDDLGGDPACWAHEQGESGLG